MENKENNINEEFEILDEIHQNQLDDIVLEKYEKKEKLKKIALISGSILVIFLIVIFIVKLVTDNSSAPQDTLVEEQITQEIDKQTQSQNNENPTENPEESSKYNEEVPVINEEAGSDNELNSVIQEVMKKEQTLAQNESKQALTPKNIPATSAAKEKTKPKHIAKKSEATKQKAAKKSKNTQNKPNKSQKVATTIPVHKPKPKAVKTAVTGHYYIQVGAFLKYDPDKRFLNKIKSHGYRYKIKEFEKNGMKIKRVYIGPFSDRASARQALVSIKKTIASGAFIVRL